MAFFAEAYTGMEPFVFFSCERADRERADELITAIWRRCFVWFDRADSFETGMTSDTEERLMDCDVFVAFVTPGYLASNARLEELQFAARLRKNVVAVVESPSAAARSDYSSLFKGCRELCLWKYPSGKDAAEALLGSCAWFAPTMKPEPESIPEPEYVPEQEYVPEPEPVRSPVFGDQAPSGGSYNFNAAYNSGASFDPSPVRTAGTIVEPAEEALETPAEEAPIVEKKSGSKGGKAASILLGIGYVILSNIVISFVAQMTSGWFVRALVAAIPMTAYAVLTVIVSKKTRYDPTVQMFLFFLISVVADLFRLFGLGFFKAILAAVLYKLIPAVIGFVALICSYDDSKTGGAQ